VVSGCVVDPDDRKCNDCRFYLPCRPMPEGDVMRCGWRSSIHQFFNLSNIIAPERRDLPVIHCIQLLPAISLLHVKQVRMHGDLLVRYSPGPARMGREVYTTQVVPGALLDLKMRFVMKLRSQDLIDLCYSLPLHRQPTCPCTRTQRQTWGMLSRVSLPDAESRTHRTVCT
jgi:hypothetical protein